MRKLINNYFTLICICLLFNSCQKEQNNNVAGLIEQTSKVAIDKTSPSETVTLLPDLTIDKTRLQSSAIVKTSMFKTTDCAMVEGCVSGIGKRKLLRFDVATPNIGDADMILGDPKLNPTDANGQPLFVYSPCHGHYHFSGYALYELLNGAGATVLTGRKQAFCLEDYERYSSTAGPAKYTCSIQGISVGWQDTYGSYLDCQWLDITNIPTGNYQLRVSINPERLLVEKDYTNNSATVPVKITK